MCFAFYAYSLPFSSLLFLFLLLTLHSVCTRLWLHKYHSWYMPGFGSAGKFYFLPLLMKQLGPWIGCVFRGNHVVHRANKALKQLWFAFLSYLSTFLQLRQIFAGNHCLRIEDFFFLWQRESIRRCFRQAFLGCSILQHTHVKVVARGPNVGREA